jgi:hypothetical protein
MRRRTRPLIALATAYGMMLAAVFGAVASGQSAVLGASAFCRTSSPAGDQAPLAPARHDLDCCIACGSGSAALPAPAVAAEISIPVLTRIAWPAASADFFRLPAGGSPFARAPPARI